MNSRRSMPMGKSDTALVTWFGNKKRFADLYNGSVFQGEQVVEAEQLEAEQTSTKELVEGREGILRDVERNRDIVMKWNDGMNLVLLACENQDKIHYAMPVRTMLYDGLSYAEQIRELRTKNKVKKNKGADEFLSGISKEDKLYPVITLVFYYGDKAWDGSKELHGLLKESSNPKIREVVERMVPNYHINLLDINSLEDTSLYKTDLQVVFGMLKYKKDRKKIEKYMQENSEFFRHVDIDTYNVLRVLLKAVATVIYVIALVKAIGYLKLKFYPSYAAFTFPFVITAIATKQTMACLVKMEQPLPILKPVVLVETIIAAVLVIYTFIRFMGFVFASNK
jgi:hypothetical protein